MIRALLPLPEDMEAPAPPQTSLADGVRETIDSLRRASAT